MSIRLLRGATTFYKYINVRNFLTVRARSYAILSVLRSSGYSFAFKRCCNPAPSLEVKENYFVSQNLKYSTKIQAKPTTVDKEIPIDVILHRINVKNRQNGTINGELLGKLLYCLEKDASKDASITEENLNSLLRSCCPQQMPDQDVGRRLEFFQKLWEHLEKNGKVTKDHVQIKLKVFKENRIAIPDYKTFMNHVVESFAGIKDTDLLSELLEVACVSGKINQASEIMLEMRNQNVALSDREFNALLTCNARNKNLKGIENVLENMMAAGLPFNIDTQATLVSGYLENGESAKALEILEKFKGQFNANHVVEFIRTGLFVNLQSSLIQRLVQELPKNLLNGPEVPLVVRNVCIELLHNKKWDLVRNLIESLPSPVFNESRSNDSFGVFVIYELIRCNMDSNLILDFAKYLKESGKNPRALHVTAEIAMQKSPPLGLPYLESLSKVESLRAHYFWPLLMYNFRRNGESGILKTLTIMSQYGLASDSDTFKDYVLPRLSITLEDPLKSLRTLSDIGVKISSILNPILATLLMQQKIKEILVVLELYPTKVQLNSLIAPIVGLAVHVRVTKSYQSYAQMVASLLKKADKQKIDYAGMILCDIFGSRLKIRSDIVAAQRFIQEMHKAGVTISSYAKETLENILKQSFPNHADVPGLVQILSKMCDRTLTSFNTMDNQNQSSFVKHPRDMSLDELEFHLIELEAKQMNTRGILRKLLQMCVRENRLERALQIKSKCDELKVQNSPGMMASIIDLYIKLKDLPKAVSSLKALQQSFPAFQIDEHKEMDLCALLVKNNQYDQAIKMLEERASKQRINGGEYIVKNVWQFLTNVAHYAAQLSPSLPPEENLTRNTFNLLNKLKYCRTNNVVLGPIIREWILRGNLKAAVEELRYMSRQYRHTPLQYELLSLLIALSNEKSNDDNISITTKEAQNLLQEVIAIISNVHGPVNMNSSLLLAFAESGTNSQIRRLLMNPEFQLNQDVLIKNCDHLSNEGAISTLLRLARGSRGLHRAINEQQIYQMLLDKFIKENDFIAAINLYERLEGDDELKISTDFLKNLVNLLKINNLEIPSNIALRAQII